MTLEGGLDRCGGSRQRHPQLKSIKEWPVAERELRVRDAMAAGHQVELSRLDLDVVAETVSVPDPAGHRPSHRLQAGVRMRQHSHVIALRSELVEEAPGPDGGKRPLRQQAMDLDPPNAAEWDDARFIAFDDRPANVRRMTRRLGRAGVDVTHGGRSPAI